MCIYLSIAIDLYLYVYLLNIHIYIYIYHIRDRHPTDPNRSGNPPNPGHGCPEWSPLLALGLASPWGLRSFILREMIKFQTDDLICLGCWGWLKVPNLPKSTCSLVVVWLIVDLLIRNHQAHVGRSHQVPAKSPLSSYDIPFLAHGS